MEYPEAKILKLLVDFFEDDYRRINHALRVLDQSKMILQFKNNYDEEVVVACALLHDVGIKQSEQDLGFNNGKTQEKYGPAIAEELLKNINFPEDKINIVKEIIGNHHSASRFDYIELEILKEADRIVNKQEKNSTPEHTKNLLH